MGIDLFKAMTKFCAAGSTSEISGLTHSFTHAHDNMMAGADQILDQKPSQSGQAVRHEPIR